VDIVAATLINHRAPSVILQSIASGLLGIQAYSGGAVTIFLGMMLHFSMSIIIAGIYVMASTRLKWLAGRPFGAGALYGLGIFVVMNLIVVPLSAFAPKPAHVSLTWLMLNIAAMIIFGVIVATVASYFLGSAADSKKVVRANTGL
jgi:uncharacterized membrane protein YagU involved in acid resistance